jgi:quinohemoprotein amine dehydrogenase
MAEPRVPVAGRDREWWEIASTLAGAPRRAASSDDARLVGLADAREARSFGSWRVVGHRPGMGGYEGRMSVARSAADEHAVTLDLRYADGTHASGKGSAIVYTGYEWRGASTREREDLAGARALRGWTEFPRWFLTDSDVLGADVRAVRDDGRRRSSPSSRRC